MRRRLAELLAQRADAKAEMDRVLAAPTAASRGLTDEEKSSFERAEARTKSLDTDIAEVRARVTELEETERRSNAADQLRRELGQGDGITRSAAYVVSEPSTYRKGGNHSYFLDLARAQVLGSGEARERLQRNDREVRALSTTDGAGGEFVPPAWFVDQAVMLARAGRVVADQVTKMALPAGTDTINLPRVATGTAVAAQATQNTAIQNTDATTDSVAASVETLAGQQVVSLQLLEQSPIQTIDQILLADLAADYAVKLDRFVLSNNATNKVGLLSVSGLNAVTYTDASPTVGELYPKVADAIQQIGTSRFLPAQKVFMHPRRWAWFTAQVDTAGRPLVIPLANMPQNVVAAMGDVVAEGLVGMLQGLPVFVDPNIPTNLGTGTNEDRIIIARTDDILLMESSPRAEAFREPLAANLSVLLRFYNYAAIHASRYPKAISVIAGTGLVPPAF